MSVNKYLPHIHVLPEDDANRQIAVGFLNEHSIRYNQVQILPPAGGWSAVRDSFEHGHNQEMLKYGKRLMVLLVDFDDRGEARRRDVRSLLEPSIAERVFVLGARGEPEELKSSLGSYEAIGKALARDCAHGTSSTWSHALLAHNGEELARMLPLVRPILF